jgi:hypothetical protein
MILLPLQTVWKFRNILETADASTGSAQRLYEPPLDMFGADAVERWFSEVERWFSESEVIDLVSFINKLK